MNLKGAVCVVTGASSGIGLEVVKLLLAQESIVMAVSRTISKETIDIEHENLYIYKCDVSNAENINELFNYTLKTLGDIDLFYANAGFAYWGKENKADWKRIEDIFRVNVISVLYSLQKMKELKKDEQFNFVVTASGVSFVSLPGYALYCATKGALIRFAESYQYELKENQILTLVYPIATKTNFFNNAGAKFTPFPIQNAQTVAEKIVHGIQRNKRSIYPFFLFRIFLVAFSILPFIKYLYLNWNNKLD